MDSATPAKRCSKCGEEKPLVEFSRNRNRKDGYKGQCKACDKHDRRECGLRLAKRKAKDAHVSSRVCTKCGMNRPLEEFSERAKGRYGRRATCKACEGSRSKRTRRAYNLRVNFSLSLADYDRMLKEQGGACAICGSTDPRGKSQYFMVDHDHHTGKVRGLLCNKCNPALGLMDDDPARLEAAAAYLRSH